MVRRLFGCGTSRFAVTLTLGICLSTSMLDRSDGQASSGKLPEDPERRLAVKLLRRWGKDIEQGTVDALDFAERPITSQQAAPILKSLPELRMLSLRATQVDDSLLPVIAEYNQKLELLYLTGTKITDEGVQHLRRLKNLKELALIVNALSDRTIDVIVELTALETLLLSPMNLNSRALTRLASLPELRSLTIIEEFFASYEYWHGRREHSVGGLLSRPPLFDKEHGEALAKIKSLDHLCLGRIRLSDEFLAALSKSSSIQELIVLKCYVSDQAIEYISQMRQLKHLELDVTSLCDDSIKPLAKLTKLRCLSLSGSDITDNSIPILAHLKELEILDLECTSITEKGHAELVSRLPRLIHLRTPAGIHVSFR